MPEPDTDSERPGDDEAHRRFREALARKTANAAAPERGQASRGKKLGPSSDKRQRQFRRKSGG